MDSYDECPICLCNFVDKSIVKDCQHNFCFKCITTWTEGSTVCPLCKREIVHILHKIQGDSNYEIYNIKITRDNAEGINMNSFSNALDVVNDSAIGANHSINEEIEIINSLEEENEQLARDDFNLIHEEIDVIDPLEEEENEQLERENFESNEDEVIALEMQALEVEADEQLERFYYEDGPVSLQDRLEYERYQDECYG